MRIAVVTFPGSLDDHDARRAVRLAGGEAVPLWHGDLEVPDVDGVVLPGGFSYGDALRAGAIARFAPVMAAVVERAHRGLPVLGICNGFQVLCESGLLPGALTRNASLHFLNRDQVLSIDNAGTAWTGDYTAGEQIVVPVKNGEGSYVAGADVLDELERDGRVVARYVGSNPNGSSRDIAGICNPAGNVVGIMPHPEHAIEALIGTAGTDGLRIFTSLRRCLAASA